MKSRAAFPQRPALPSAGGFFLAQQAKRPPRQERCGKPHARGSATPGFEATSRQMINRCERRMWMKRNAAQTGTHNSLLGPSLAPLKMQSSSSEIGLLVVHIV